MPESDDDSQADEDKEYGQAMYEFQCELLCEVKSLYSKIATLTSQRDALLAACKDIKAITSVRVTNTEFMVGQLNGISKRVDAVVTLYG